MVRFELLEPASLEEAQRLAAQHGDQALLLAGGTDLLVELKNRHKRPAYIIDLKHIAGLDTLECSQHGLRFGPLTTARQLEYDRDVRRWYPMLAETAGIIGSNQIRTTATIVGNLCNALPSAEMAPPLLALDARVTIAGSGGTRLVPLKDFFTGPRTTQVRPGEIVTAVDAPGVAAQTGMVYVRHSPRRAMDLAVVGVAAVVTMDGETFREVRIALGAVAPTPIRATEAEQFLTGKPATAEHIQRAADLAAAASRPISDIRASAEYRRDMVMVLTRRMVLEAKRRAGLQPGSYPLLKYHMSSDFEDLPAAS